MQQPNTLLCKIQQQSFIYLFIYHQLTNDILETFNLFIPSLMPHAKKGKILPFLRISYKLMSQSVIGPATALSHAGADLASGPFLCLSQIPPFSRGLETERQTQAPKHVACLERKEKKESSPLPFTAEEGNSHSEIKSGKQLSEGRRLSPNVQGPRDCFFGGY